MRRLGWTVLVSVAVLVLALAPAAAAGKPIVQHFTFESEPFLLDLSDPSGSAQCDVQAVGYDTGIANWVAFADDAGLISHDIYIQSLSTIFTNPANGKVVEFRLAAISKVSYIDNADGSLTVTEEFSGLNVLYRGERVTTLAGRVKATAVVRFGSKGNVVSVEVVEDLTPHLAHAYALLCSLLA